MVIVPQDGVPGKVCFGCGVWKTCNQFYEVRTNTDGYSNKCKECRSIYNKKWYIANRQLPAIHGMRTIETKEGITGKICTACNTWKPYSDYYNKDESSDGFRSICKNCTKEQTKKAEKERYHADIEYFRLVGRIKRGIRRSREYGTITSDEWEYIKKKYNYTCLCCGRKEPCIKLSMDHVIPVSLGGETSIDNIQPLCISCNSSKGDKIIEYRPDWKV